MDLALNCAQCGTPVSGSRFCTECGTPLPTADGGHAYPGMTAEAPTALATLTMTGAEPGAPPQPVTTVRRTWSNVLAVLVVAALGLSCWALLHGAERHIVSGTLLLTDSSYNGVDPGDSCTGSGGYGDIGGGAQVVLMDGNGATMSTSRLSQGQFDGLGCVFSFTLPDVRHADFYALTIAGGDRGELQYSYAELAGDDWSLQLSLGDA